MEVENEEEEHGHHEQAHSGAFFWRKGGEKRSTVKAREGAVVTIMGPDVRGCRL